MELRLEIFGDDWINLQQRLWRRQPRRRLRRSPLVFAVLLIVLATTPVGTGFLHECRAKLHNSGSSKGIQERNSDVLVRPTSGEPLEQVSATSDADDIPNWRRNGNSDERGVLTPLRNTSSTTSEPFVTTFTSLYNREDDSTFHRTRNGASNLDVGSKSSQDSDWQELSRPNHDRNGAAVPRNRNEWRVESSKLREMWSHRHARTAEEGIRREKTTQLSSVLAKAEGQMKKSGGRYAARTITGLISALAEEAADLKVEVRANQKTPLWRKQIDSVKIDFSRLSFKPLKLGGSTVRGSKRQSDTEASQTTSHAREFSNSTTSAASNADEMFDRIDVDNSGDLDSEEIAQALNLATLISATDKVRHLDVIKKLAAELVKLYDFNGDGVVDRDEYRTMIEDMAALRESREDDEVLNDDERLVSIAKNSWIALAKQATGDAIGKVASWIGFGGRKIVDDGSTMIASSENTNTVDDSDALFTNVTSEWSLNGENVVDLSNSPDIDTFAKSVGSITLSDLKLDLRRLVFGAIPILKRITPGGPLVLEPFTVTIDGSFNRFDIMDSALLDAGLRQLVAMALRRRVGKLRDFLEGALFYGRSWKLNSESGPSVEVPKLSNIEFDNENRLIITGRARVQSNKDSPIIENAFKVRTKIGIRRDGRVIRLVEPELALVLECPKSFEENIATVCTALDIPRPPKPKPLYSFFPIYSPFKVDDNDGFDLGEDNCITAIFIEDGALRFQLSAVIRPGRFLGSHYIAFTVPIRTFIVTVDRVKAGIRAARKAKKEAKAKKDEQLKQSKKTTRVQQIEKAIDAELNHQNQSPDHLNKLSAPPKAPKSFFSRFVDGYLQAQGDFSDRARMTKAIRDFFGQQEAQREEGSDSEDSTTSRDKQ